MGHRRRGPQPLYPDLDHCEAPGDGRLYQYPWRAFLLPALAADAPRGKPLHLPSRPDNDLVAPARRRAAEHRFFDVLRFGGEGVAVDRTSTCVNPKNLKLCHPERARATGGSKGESKDPE